METYKCEKERAETFTDWPVPQFVTPEDLAAAGLYYTKHNDEVKCAFCSVVISKWELGDEAINKHRSCKPDCSFIRGIPVGDIPSPPPAKYKSAEERQKTYKDWHVPYFVTPDDLAAAGFYYTHRGDLVICAFCSAGLYNWEPGDKITNKHISCNPECEFIQGKAVGNIPLPSPTRYKCEITRIQTFENWSISDVVTPEDLAAAGLYYTQMGNSVRCAFCFVIISNWEPGDNPITKHDSCQSSCRFIRGLPSGDIPKSPHPKYRDEDERRQSFEGFNKKSDGSAAGFYYTKRGNLVMCAYCSTSFDDYNCCDPIAAHLFCNPNCPFLHETLSSVIDNPYNINKYEPVKSEQRRLNTFMDCSLETDVSAEGLAAAGFYFKERFVYCAFCETVVDIPADVKALKKEHDDSNYKCRRSCPFSKGIPCGNNPSPPNEKYKCEKTRRDTFTYWPKRDIIIPVELAAAGFYYTQRGDLVVCAFCSAGAYNWSKGDTAIDKHRYSNPYCCFIQGKIVGNIPYPATTKYKCEKTRLETFANWPVPHIVTPQDLAAAGFFCPKGGDFVKCAFCFLYITDWKRGSKAIEEHRLFNPNCRFLLGLPVDNIPLLPEPTYMSEKERLETFADWPVTDIVTPEELAAAGFYYTKHNDQVKCAFCLEVISSWKPGDKAVNKHRTLNDNCLFIQGLPAGNIPRPPQPEFNDEEVRLGTYTDWPVPHIVTPADLAAAGFYYTHRGDLVICAFCSASVYNWKTGDIPLNKHISYNPNCSFIQGMPEENILQPVTVDNCPQISQKMGDTAQSMQRYADTLQTVIEKLEEEMKCLKEARQCKICMDADINTVILPCGHLVVCVSCADGLTNCPTCRVVVQTIVRTYQQ